MKSIAVCADDYAINKFVSAGIRDLIMAKRLSATSCMTNSPDWPEEAQLLKQFLNKVDIGLHFNLTHQFSDNNAKDLNTLIIQSLLRVLNRQWIEQELHQQLDKFEQALGVMPNYIDGHHHVHAFPIVREVLIQVVKQRYKPNQYAKIWLRNVSPAFKNSDSLIKMLVLRMLSHNFDKLAIKNGFRISGELAGLYSLSLDANYPNLVKYWLHNIKTTDLLMCHPGLLATGELSDKSMRVRQMEYQFFMSSEFVQLCQEENIQIVRLSNI